MTGCAYPPSQTAIPVWMVGTAQLRLCPPYKLIRSDRFTAKSHPLISGNGSRLRFVFGNVFAHDAFVTLQFPLVIRTVGEPIGNTDLPVDLTGGHGDARLLTGGNNFLHAELGIAENGDKSNKHDGLR